MNLYTSIYPNSEISDSITDLNEDQIQSTLIYSLNVIDSNGSSLWEKMYNSYLPPAIAKRKLNEIPLFFKKQSKNFLFQSQNFFYNNKNVPFSNFILGLFQEYTIENKKTITEILETFKRGAKKGDPFCMMKTAEILILENEQLNLKKSLTYIIKSFIITSIEPNKFLPENLLLNFHNTFWNLDSLWYISFYFDTQKIFFLEILNEVIKTENYSIEFGECLIYILNNLYKEEELVNILKKLEDCYKKDKSRITAYHFCMFSFFITKLANLPINFVYISQILKQLADEGNILACEKYAFYLDFKKDYLNAFPYFKKAEENLMPNSILFMGNYYCSLKNPGKTIDIKLASEYYKKASFMGISNLMEYMKILELNKDYDFLFDIANFSYSSGIFGSELILGECYEKGKGIEKNLYIAMSLYKRGLKKHRSGSVFLYRLSRTLEKTKNNLSQDFYKICFNLYIEFFHNDRKSDDNIWILDAYRLASMLGSGRGVARETQKANEFINLILNADINFETSSYTCLFYYIIKLKRKNIKIQKTFSSILSMDTVNSFSSPDAINNDKEISYIGNINKENNIYRNNIKYQTSLDSDFNMGGNVNDSSEKSVKIQINASNILKRRKVFPKDYLKINLENINNHEINKDKKNLNVEYNKNNNINIIKKRIIDTEREILYDSNINLKLSTLEKHENSILKIQDFQNLNNNFNYINNNLNNKNNIIEQNKIPDVNPNNISKFTDINNLNSMNNNHNSIIINPENKGIFTPNINLDLILKTEDIPNNLNASSRKSMNVSMTILTESDNSLSNIEDYFIFNLKNSIEKNKTFNNPPILNNSNNSFKNQSNTLTTDDIKKIKEIFQKIKNNGVKFIEVNDLIFDELLASGGYSKVYSGWYQNKKMAIKEFKNISKDTIIKIFEEIHLQTSLFNDKINKVFYVGLDTSPNKICCINKFMPYNLRYIISNAKLDLRQKVYITQQLVEVILFLHSQIPPIVHRDLKPENILVGDDLKIELCDFGIYKLLTNENSKTETENRIFTVRYAPPEVINNMHFICKGSDIWSFGMILYDLFYETQPWSGLSSDDIINCIKKNRPFVVKNVKNIPSRIISIIKKCTNYDYDHRPKVLELQLELNELIKEI